MSVRMAYNAVKALDRFRARDASLERLKRIWFKNGKAVAANGFVLAMVDTEGNFTGAVDPEELLTLSHSP